MKRTQMLVLALTVAASAAPAMAAENAVKNIYTQKCGVCHAKDGTGNPAMAKVFKVDPSALNLVDETTVAQKDAELVLITTNGQGKMPAFGTKLKAEEIKEIVAFVRTLAPKEKVEKK